MGVIVCPIGKHTICICIREAKVACAWAFVDWDDDVVMVPVMGDIPQETVEATIAMWWPTIKRILWPDQLDVVTKQTKGRQ